MPRINPVNLQETTNQIRATLEAVKAKLGMIPNLFTTFAQAPAALDGYLKLSEALTSGRLSAAQRETIALTVGQVNQCQYCLSAHTLLAKGAGLSAEQIKEARLQKSGDGLATLAAKIVEQRGVLEDEDIAKAKAAGFDDGLLIEIVANVALNILTNYTNHIAGTEVDFPLVGLDM